MSEPIRVLCVFKLLDRGGSETMCMNLYRNIDRTKIQFDFVKHSSKKCDYEDEILSLGGKIYTAPTYYEFNRLTYEKWWKNHFENHPEHQIVHGHYYTIADVYFKIAHQYGRKTIAHSHSEMRFDLQNRNKIKDYLVQKHCGRLEEYSDLCLACSKAAGDWIFNEYEIVENGIDTKTFKYNEKYRKEIRDKYNIKNEFVLGIVARISEPKNPYGAIDIFKELHKLNEETKLLWVGGNFMADSIPNYVKKLGLSDSVILTGSVADAYKYYQAFDAFVLPSFYEGLGIAAIESQAAGLKTYVSNRVPKDVEVTKLCKRIVVDDTSKWASSIQEDIGTITERTQYNNTVKTSGYDIKDVVEKFTKIYINI